VYLFFLKSRVVSSIDAQTNVKKRQTACKTARAFQGPLGFSGASYGRDASHRQGMMGRSMAARASQGYRCTPLSTESGAYLWNGSSTLTKTFCPHGLDRSTALRTGGFGWRLDWLP
jgi:hypothetical protein